jgi:hypothetical protein
MKTKTIFTLLLVFLLATVVTNTGPTSAAAAAESSAFGAGSFFFQNEEVVFSFTAVSSGGTAGKGTAQFDYLATQTTVTVKLSCVKIDLSQGAVTMSGKVQESSDTDFPKNANVVFGAIDGSLSPIPFFADRITPLFVRAAGVNCNDGLPSTVLRPEEGQVVIVP